MIIFITACDGGRDERLTVRSVRNVFPNVPVFPIGISQVRLMNRMLRESQTSICMTIRAGTIVLESFQDHVSIWVQRMMIEPIGFIEFSTAKPQGFSSQLVSEIPRPDSHSGLDFTSIEEFKGSGPTLWKNLSDEFSFFPERDELPFDHYMEIVKMKELASKGLGMKLMIEDWIAPRRVTPQWMRREEEWNVIAPLLNDQVIKPFDDNPKVSVIMSLYNESDRFLWAVRSVLNQTFKDWELILVDDGSHDDTRNKLDRLLITERIRIIVNDNNRGKAASLNKALTWAKGTWVMELDGDDWLAPRCMELLMASAESGELENALWCSSYYEWQERTNKQLIYKGIRQFPEHRGIKQILIEGLPLAPRFYRKEALVTLGGWPITDLTEGRLYEDMHLIIRLMRKYKYTYLPESLYHRRIRLSSITRTHNKEYMKWIEWAMDTYSIDEPHSGLD
ncbi:glycosyltransferase family 2 protein [Paenibacillus antarcticus]|uniref:Glycosyltransferase 2-like domain-containing protein n=1 Tax=Paenibacillus antarcticus TaxID=253703 RepID=A0A168PGJ6_9BACL|nr:glycosyltransferase family 2 protein [Paenibacillus antarcticus]OAB46739.1 hypothetical protein PBAT_08660 [Paenibacillus antarcticus]